MHGLRKRGHAGVPGVWVFTAAALIATSAQAATASSPDSADIEQVTISVTRVATKLSEAPATVSVIDAATIEQRMAQNIKDLVRFEPGVAVRSSPSRFTAAGSSTGRDGHSGFNVRGLEGNRVLIQVDGVRIPDSYSFGAQSLGRGDYVDVDILKSVEIVRGPASALYGSDGLAGAVTFLTKDPSDALQDGRPGSLAGRAGYASADNARAESLLAAGKSGRWETLVSYTRRDGEGQETRGDNRAPNVDRTVANPEEDASNAVLAKVLFAPNEANRVRLTLDHLDRDVHWNVLSAVAKPPLSATSTLALRAFDEMKRDRVSLDHRFAGTGGAIDSAHTSVYYQASRTRQYSSEDRNIAADRIRDAKFDNAVWGTAVELTSTIEHGALTHRFVYGVDYSKTRQEGVRDGTVPPAGETFPTHAFPDTHYTLAGVFVQDEITFGAGRVSLYPALRWDYFDLSPQNDPLFVAATPADPSDSHVTPKLGLLYRLTDRVNLFANAAAGFKAPAPSQVNNGFTNPVANYRSISNASLSPETSKTVEIGLRTSSERGSASLAAFTGRYQDFIDQFQVGGTFSPTDPAVYQYVNLGKVRIHGAEASAKVVLGRGFAVSGSAAYAHGDTKTNGTAAPLATIEPFKTVLGLDWNAPGDRLGAQLVAVHSQGKQRSRIGVTCTPACFVPEGFTVLDALGWWRIKDQITLRAGVFNLTNQKYWWWSDVRGVATNAALDAYSQPGRNATVSLAMSF